MDLNYVLFFQKPYRDKKAAEAISKQQPSAPLSTNTASNLPSQVPLQNNEQHGKYSFQSDNHQACICMFYAEQNDSNFIHLML